MNKQAFIEECVECTKKADMLHWGILPSVTIAQAILESGWGESELARNANNYHGLNNYNDSITNHYAVYPARVPQEVNGKWEWKIELMCKFDSMLDSFRCLRDWYFGREKYKPIIGEMDYSKVTQFLTGKYATATNYGDCLNRIIREYGLTQYDHPVNDKYYVQAGAFMNLENALNFKMFLKSIGINSLIKEYDCIYFIQVGCFENQKYAIEFQRKLKELGISTIIKNEIKGVEFT